MKCDDCGGSGMKCDDTFCSLNNERTKIHINCTHCEKGKPCVECQGLGGFQLVTIEECYPGACALPGADKNIKRCCTCKQVKLRSLTEIELQAFRQLGNQIGCDNDEWMISKVRQCETTIHCRPVRLRPKEYEVS